MALTPLAPVAEVATASAPDYVQQWQALAENREGEAV
jgi:hypothetical protein